MDVRPFSAVVEGFHLFDVEALVAGVVFEDAEFLVMGLGVSSFDDFGLSDEPDLVLEVNLRTWRKISYLYLPINDLGAADLLFACHAVCMT